MEDLTGQDFRVVVGKNLEGTARGASTARRRDTDGSIAQKGREKIVIGGLSEQKTRRIFEDPPGQRGSGGWGKTAGDVRG